LLITVKCGERTSTQESLAMEGNGTAPKTQSAA